MSVFSRNSSSKNVFNKYTSPIKPISNKRSNSVENYSKNSLVKCLYKQNVKKYNKNLLILNYIMTNSEKRYSIKTTFSDTICENETMKYDLNMVNNYEENLNSSLSFISEFDLEDDGKNIEDNSFNSENDDDSGGEIEINTKCDKNIKDKGNEEDEFDIKLDQDFIEIKRHLLSLKEL